MPRKAYSQKEKEIVREKLIQCGLQLMASQGIAHTTVEQVYQHVGISRTFFYSFFKSKEDLIVEALYLQQPNIIAYLNELMNDSTLSWREAVTQFLTTCCYGEQNGIIILTLEEQQALFKHLSNESYQYFRAKQRALFQQILSCMNVHSDNQTVGLFTNLILSLLVVHKAIPHSLPFLVPEAADATITFQINALVNALERLKLP